MLREIKKKQIILENRKPYSHETAEHIREINMVDWISSSLRMDKSSLSRQETERILGGEFITNASLNEHAVIERYRDLINSVNDMAAMSYSLNKEMLATFYKKLTGKPDAPYRKENPVLVALNYTPPHPSLIEEQMDILMNWFYGRDTDRNPVLKATNLHNRIIEVYPYDVYSEAIARAAMYYFLMENGYPPFELIFTEQEYNAAVAEYLKRGRTEPFYSGIERSIYNKMVLLMRLTDEGII